MIHKKKPQYLLWVGLLALSSLTGYYLSALFIIPGVNLENIGDKLAYVIQTPTINYWNKNSPECMAGMFTVWLVAFAHYLTNLKNYMFGKEFGSAEWGNIRRFNQKLADYKGRRKKTKYLSNKNRVLSQNVRISYDTEKTLLNNNQIVVGGSGAGKTAFFMAPNLLQFYGSNVYTDPKGGLLHDFGNILEKEGINVKVLNLLDGEMKQSLQYNPFKYVHNFAGLQRLITNILANTTPAETMKSDPFWEKAETLYLLSIFAYVWLECPRSEPIYQLDKRKQGRIPVPNTNQVLGKNFRTVLYLLDEAEVSEDENAKSLLSIRMEELAKEHELGKKHIAVKNYYKCIRGAGDTVRSIIISANSRFAPFDNEDLLRILDDDDLNLPELGVGVKGDKKTQTALFCLIADDDNTFNFVPGMLYTQLFQELYRCARFYDGNKLPIDVGFWFDEFANIKMPASFDKILATCRSRNVYCTIVLQSLAQIKALYKDDWEGLLGNCDTFIYLGGNEQSSHKYISETLGKWTIDKRSTGKSLGRNRSDSRNYDVLGRELMTADEVNNLDNSKMILRVRGQNPIIDNKWFLFRKPVYKYVKSLGKYEVNSKTFTDPVTGRIITIKEQGEFSYLSDESLEYYRKRKEEGENVEVYDIDLETFLAIDFSQVQEDSVEDLKKIMNENSQKIEEMEKDYVKELNTDLSQEDIEKNFKEDLERLSIMELVLMYEYTEEQQREIQLGLHNGLSESKIKSYMSPSNPATKMGIIRELQERDKRTKQKNKN